MLDLAVTLSAPIFAAGSANVWRGNVFLYNGDTGKYSSQYAGRYGKGAVNNSTSSLESVRLRLRYSTGSSWQNGPYVVAAPGEFLNTRVDGDGIDKLYRVYISIEDQPYGRPPRSQATGTVYTD